MRVVLLLLAAGAVAGSAIGAGAVRAVRKAAQEHDALYDAVLQRPRDTRKLSQRPTPPEEKP